MKDMITKPKIWLIIIAIMHTFMGVIGSYITMGGSVENLAIFLYLGIFLVDTVQNQLLAYYFFLKIA